MVNPTDRFTGFSTLMDEGSVADKKNLTLPERARWRKMMLMLVVAVSSRAHCWLVRQVGFFQLPPAVFPAIQEPST